MRSRKADAPRARSHARDAKVPAQFRKILKEEEPDEHQRNCESQFHGLGSAHKGMELKLDSLIEKADGQPA
jgi:hypothetical protein